MQQITKLLNSALSPLYDPREVKAITRLLLEEVCGLSFTEIVMRRDDVLPETQRQVLTAFAERLSKGEPVQQVLGYAWFRGRKFIVSPDVLIPRPETEELVNMIVNNSVNNPVHKVLDIGTGSGCIALSLALDINTAFITAADLSTAALTIAMKNAIQLETNNVRFVQTDILKEEFCDFSTDLSTPETFFDVIVSNPPYICQHESAQMQSNVLDHEPHLALFVPDHDPLLFYRAIGSYALRHLSPSGTLYFEINQAYGSETCKLLVDIGYQNVQLFNDFTGRNRFVTANK